MLCFRINSISEAQIANETCSHFLYRDLDARHRNHSGLLPLVQHFVSYNGPDVSSTTIRMIGIQSLQNNYWLKLDAKVPIEWENDNAIPASAEVQLGKMFSPSFGAYVDLMAGVGGDKPYEWGVGVGARFNY